MVHEQCPADPWDCGKCESVKTLAQNLLGRALPGSHKLRHSCIPLAVDTVWPFLSVGTLQHPKNLYQKIDHNKFYDIFYNV